jgi:hypothetical protein
MTTTAAPYGLIPIEKQGGNPNQGGAQRAYPITANLTYAMAVGQLAQLAAGVISVGTAAPAGASVIGVITGFEFTDPVMKYAVQDSMLPANAINSGYTNVKVFINDDPLQLYRIQANGPVTQAMIGTKMNIVNNDVVTTATKRSQGAATIAGGATLLVVGPVVAANNKLTDPFTEIIVKISSILHLYNL